MKLSFCRIIYVLWRLEFAWKSFRLYSSPFWNQNRFRRVLNSFIKSWVPFDNKLSIRPQVSGKSRPYIYLSGEECVHGGWQGEGAHKVKAWEGMFSKDGKMIEPNSRPRKYVHWMLVKMRRAGSLPGFAITWLHDSEQIINWSGPYMDFGKVSQENINVWSMKHVHIFFL